MSDLWEFAVNFYHLRLVPTVRRMLARRRLPYTLLMVLVLLISASALSLLVCHATEALTSHNRLSAEYETYLVNHLRLGNQRSPLPELREILALARGLEVAVALFLIMIWLFASIVIIVQVMTSVVNAESYVYGLYMIYGADRGRLSRQLSLECTLAGLPALALGLPAGYGIHRALNGGGGFPVPSLLLMALCFLLLILLCSSVLSRRMLSRSCMQMLNTADTSDITSSPRRSHIRGFLGKKHPFTAAVLAMWRMRRHYAALALAVLLVTAPAFAILSPIEAAPSPSAPLTLRFPEGIDRETLSIQYLPSLWDDARISSLQYKAANSAKDLGLHVLADHSGIGQEAGLPLGERYATSSFRIACGDGDTFYELGGNLTIPEECKDISIPSSDTFGYLLEAVPVGCAVYVHPEDMSPPLSLHVGDMVKLYPPAEDGGLPYEESVTQSDYVTVRIIGIVSVPNLRGERGGPEICPRITEDYLYLSPPDYERLQGSPYAQTFVAEEADLSVFFPDAESDACILVMPRGSALFSEPPACVTVISPEETLKEPFRDSLGKESLPDDTYFINYTAKGMGVYMGSEEAYRLDSLASEALYKHQKTALYQHTILPPMKTQEYRVEQIIYTEVGGAPYILFPHSEDLQYSALQNDLCAFRLEEVSKDVPLMTAVSEEAYLLETDILLGASFFGRTCYVGTTLLPAFVTAMKANNLNLQFSEDTFRHTKTLIQNSFTLGNRHYLLADEFPYETHPHAHLRGPRLQADSYPRVVTGVGSFCPLGNICDISILSAQEQGIWGVFGEGSIGSLQQESNRLPGQYAYDSWVIAPAEELLSHQLPEAGHGVLLTEDPSTCPIQAGDVLSLSLRQDTSGFLSDPQFVSLQLHDGDLLPYLLEHITYPYVDIVVDEVRQGERTALALAETDLCTALDTAGLHQSIQVFLQEDIDVAGYLDLYTLTDRLAKASGGQAILEYDGQYLVRTQTRSMADPAVMRLLGCLMLGVMPLLLVAAQLAFMGKRSEEFRILVSVGIPPARRRRQFAMETILTSLLLGGVSALACPLGYLILLILTDLTGAALPYTGFEPMLCLAIALLTVIFSLVAGLLSYLRMTRKHRASTAT